MVRDEVRDEIKDEVRGYCGHWSGLLNTQLGWLCSLSLPPTRPLPYKQHLSHDIAGSKGLSKSASQLV